MKTKHKEGPQSKQNSSIKNFLLLFGLPVGLLIFSLLVLQLPRLFAQPNYDFIYAYCPSFGCSSTYRYEDGEIVRLQDDGFDHRAQLRYYNSANDSHRSVSLSEVNQLNLDDSSRSPDGYQLSYDRRSDTGFLFFYTSSDGGWSLNKDWRSKPISLAAGMPAKHNINKIAWVTE